MGNSGARILDAGFLGVGFGTLSARDAIVVPAFPLCLPDRGGLGGYGNSQSIRLTLFWYICCISFRLVFGFCSCVLASVLPFGFGAFSQFGSV